MNIYTTEQVSEILGTPPGTIRQWKSRKASQLAEGRDWLIQDGVTYWTEAGLAQLQQFKDKKPVTQRVTSRVTQGNTGSVTPAVTTDFFEPMLEQLSDAVTPTLMARLMSKVTQKLGTALLQRPPAPTTNQHCLEVLAAIGITPGEDPVALLTGNTAGYLEAGDDDEEN